MGKLSEFVRHFLSDEFGVRCAFIDMKDAVSKLETLYQDRHLLASKAQSAREFALSYDWEHILPPWEQLLLHEVARRKTNLLVSGIPDTPRGTEGTSNLAPDKHTASEMMAEVLQEAQPERTIRIPVKTERLQS